MKKSWPENERRYLKIAVQKALRDLAFKSSWPSLLFSFLLSKKNSLSFSFCWFRHEGGGGLVGFAYFISLVCVLSQETFNANHFLY